MMDHRLVEVNGQYTILLDRIEADEQSRGTWEVMFSTFITAEYRYDEWLICETTDQALAVIKDFSEESAQAFITRACAKHTDLFG